MGQLASSRLQEALRTFEKLDLKKADHIIEADDVFDVLNLSIEEKCHYLMFRSIEVDESRFLRSAVRVGTNLEHIGDAACHIAKRVNIAYYNGIQYVPFDLMDMESIALASIRESVNAYLKKDMNLVEEACLREPQQDEIYKRKLEELQTKMQREPENIPFLLLWYSVMKYLEKVCDFTLNIGEQAIYLTTGRRLKFSQYQQLDRLLYKESQVDYEYHPYYDGISGAIVARMVTDEKVLVYKEGSKKKIAAEAKKLEDWQKLFPHLAPQVIQVDNVGEREALLREYVSGTHLSDLYLSSIRFSEKEKATHIFIELLISIWNLTVKKERPEISYIKQIRTRLAEVYAMHPYLEFLANQNKLDKILNKVEQIEDKFAPAFAVWLHGDLNINNVFYQNDQIQFIDVHRSNYGDYLADMGVFLVSTLRSPNISSEIGKEMEAIRNITLKELRAFSKTNSDNHFDVRLNLSLARSYITSSRITVDKSQANMLFEKGIELLKGLIKQ
jgi:phosphate uptake regulator/aminoglycoside phosphotransferase